MAFKVTEPKSKKEIRLARELLADKNGWIVRFTEYKNKKRMAQLFTIDDKFKNALNTIGLKEERWKLMGHQLLYINVIKHYANSEHKVQEEELRKRVIEEWSKDEYEKENIAFLLEALSYFHIKVDEWIKYGDTVLDMYKIYDIPDIEEFGIIPVWK